MAVDLQKEHGGGSLDCSLDGLRNNYPAYEALLSQNYGKNMRFLIILFEVFECSYFFVWFQWYLRATTTTTLTNSSHFTFMSVIRRACTHAVPRRLISRSRACSCRHRHASGDFSPSTYELVVAFYPHLQQSHPSLPLFCHLIFTHISLPIEVAEDNWQMLMKRHHNSCCLAAYANMFTYEGILSTENVPHGDASHVCCQAPASETLKHEIMFSFLLSVSFYDTVRRLWSSQAVPSINL